jgi:hypothetical protein
MMNLRGGDLESLGYRIEQLKELWAFENLGGLRSGLRSTRRVRGVRGSVRDAEYLRHPWSQRTGGFGISANGQDMGPPHVESFRNASLTRRCNPTHPWERHGKEYQKDRPHQNTRWKARQEAPGAIRSLWASWRGLIRRRSISPHSHPTADLAHTSLTPSLLLSHHYRTALVWRQEELRQVCLHSGLGGRLGAEILSVLRYCSREDSVCSLVHGRTLQWVLRWWQVFKYFDVLDVVFVPLMHTKTSVPSKIVPTAGCQRRVMIRVHRSLIEKNIRVGKGRACRRDDKALGQPLFRTGLAPSCIADEWAIGV